MAWCVPFLAAGGLLIWLEPLAALVSIACFAHAWIIPELYAHRGASVVHPKGPRNEASEPVAQGLLADLLGHDARALQRETGLALERGDFGVWLVGEAGVLLVNPGGRRVHAFCVRVPDRDLPPSDRIAHLLLALRADETGFATVANHAYSGSTWRIRRRLRKPARPALSKASELARTSPGG